MQSPTSLRHEDVRCRRLLFRCWHRGTQENDLILGAFGPCTDTPILREWTEALCGIPAINLRGGPDQGPQPHLSGRPVIE
jgi:hypothetical protein